MSKHSDGQLCVITRSCERQQLSIGHIVQVREPPPVPPAPECAELFANHFPIQYIRGPAGEGYHPSAWMRPIDKDTDARDDEVIRSYRGERIDNSAPASTT